MSKFFITKYSCAYTFQYIWWCLNWKINLQNNAKKLYLEKYQFSVWQWVTWDSQVENNFVFPVSFFTISLGFMFITFHVHKKFINIMAYITIMFNDYLYWVKIKSHSEQKETLKLESYFIFSSLFLRLWFVMVFGMGYISAWTRTQNE